EMVAPVSPVVRVSSTRLIVPAARMASSTMERLLACPAAPEGGDSMFTRTPGRLRSGYRERGPPDGPSGPPSRVSLRTSAGARGELLVGPVEDRVEVGRAGAVRRECEVVDAAVDGPDRHVGAEPWGPLDDVSDVEHGVGAVEPAVERRGRAAHRRAAHEHGARDVEPGLDGFVAEPHGAQEPGARGKPVVRLPLEVEVPLAPALAVQEARVVRGHAAHGDVRGDAREPF